VLRDCKKAMEDEPEGVLAKQLNCNSRSIR